MGAVSRACLRTLELLGRRSASGAPAPIFVCSRNYARKKILRKFVDPFAYPTLYVGEKKLEATPERPPRPERDPFAPRQRRRTSNNKLWRGLVKTRFVNAQRKREIQERKASVEKRDIARVKRWRTSAARVRAWKPEAEAVLRGEKPFSELFYTKPFL